jgi:hypothetical protein
MGDRTKLCDYTNTPNDQFIAKPITTPEITAESYEVSPSLLNLITREQFGGSAVEDASMHLHDFIEICDMQKFKNVESNVLKLKLFPFSLRGKAKEWLHSLPTGSINSWDDLKEAFIKKYYPLLKYCKIETISSLLGKMKMNMLPWLGIGLNSCLELVHHMGLMNGPFYTLFTMV